MTTKRLFILLVVMLAGLSSVLFLPKQLGFQPVGVKLELPKMVGIWYGEDMAVSEKERKVLGEETEFARKAYRNARGNIITASVVLSGQDMNTSIHRPERCMPAQGFAVIDNRPVAVPLREGGVMQATRLLNVRNIPADETSGPVSNYNLTYYWFIGHKDMTASHFARTWYDIRDRLLHGYNQRWAYVTVAASLPPDAMNDPRIERTMDEWLQTFIKQLLPQIRVTDTPAAG